MGFLNSRKKVTAGKRTVIVEVGHVSSAEFCHPLELRRYHEPTI